MKNIICNLRKDMNLTQECLAKTLGVSRQTIISIEKGKYNPSIILAYRISKVLDKRIEDIFLFEEKTNEA